MEKTDLILFTLAFCVLVGILIPPSQPDRLSDERDGGERRGAAAVEQHGGRVGGPEAAGAAAEAGAVEPGGENLDISFGPFL